MLASGEAADVVGERPTVNVKRLFGRGPAARELVLRGELISGYCGLICGGYGDDGNWA